MEDWCGGLCFCRPTVSLYVPFQGRTMPVRISWADILRIRSICNCFFFRILCKKFLRWGGIVTNWVCFKQLLNCAPLPLILFCVISPHARQSLRRGWLITLPIGLWVFDWSSITIILASAIALKHDCTCIIGCNIVATVFTVDWVFKQTWIYIIFRAHGSSYYLIIRSFLYIFKDIKCLYN